MALRKIGTSRDVAAFTLTGDTGYRELNGAGQTWATPSRTALILNPGRYLIEGPATVTQYNASPWTSEGSINLPAVVEYTVPKSIYSAQNGVLKITRL
ncbi:hypothetical protein COM45_04975 [Corynebacterium accolens]|uniref:Uncharacterized protein n=1 Tax=Corynebacterium accolens TaxID=38284 RepID=A0A2A4AKX5_9CORY|nr:hypothetical protein COM45_04975 [Corynebacterium accolens]